MLGSLKQLNEATYVVPNKLNCRLSLISNNPCRLSLMSNSLPNKLNRQLKNFIRIKGLSKLYLF